MSCSSLDCHFLTEPMKVRRRISGKEVLSCSRAWKNRNSCRYSFPFGATLLDQKHKPEERYLNKTNA